MLATLFQAGANGPARTVAANLELDDVLALREVSRGMRAACAIMVPSAVARKPRVWSALAGAWASLPLAWALELTERAPLTVAERVHRDACQAGRLELAQAVAARNGITRAWRAEAMLLAVKHGHSLVVAWLLETYPELAPAAGDLFALALENRKPDTAAVVSRWIAGPIRARTAPAAFARVCGELSARDSQEAARLLGVEIAQVVGGDDCPLVSAVINSKLDTAKWLAAQLPEPVFAKWLAHSAAHVAEGFCVGHYRPARWLGALGVSLPRPPRWAIHEASAAGDLDGGRWLASMGAGLDDARSVMGALTGDGPRLTTALGHACAGGRFEMAVWLWSPALAASGDPNLGGGFSAAGMIQADARDADGLRLAALGGHLELARWLWAAAGLQVDDLGEVGCDSLFRQVLRRRSSRSKEVAEWLWSVRPCADDLLGRLAGKRAALDEAIIAGNCEIICWLCPLVLGGEAGHRRENCRVAVRALDREIRRGVVQALDLLVGEKLLEVTGALLRTGLLPMELFHPHAGGSSAFVTMCDRGELEAAKLVWASVAPNWVAWKDGLLRGAAGGRLRVVCWLLGLGPARLDCRGRACAARALILACERGCVETAERLWSTGLAVADIRAAGKTPAQLFGAACSSGHLGLARWLRSLGGVRPADAAVDFVEVCRARSPACVRCCWVWGLGTRPKAAAACRILRRASGGGRAERTRRAEVIELLELICSGRPPA